MSFAYMPFFTGDYLRDTRHLSMAEHGAYFLALMHCWDSKGPMPLDERKQFAIVCARSNDEMEAWRRVRADFFVLADDGWYQPRMADEVAKSERLSAALREAGLKSAEARRTKARQAKAEGRLSQGSGLVEPRLVSPSPSPSLSSNQEERNTGAEAPVAPRKRGATLSIADLVAEGVDEQHARDWMRIRGRKALTRTAWDLVVAEAGKAGLTPAQAVQHAASHSWVGFKAQWCSSTDGGKVRNRRTEIEEQNRLVAEQWLKGMRND